MDVPIYSSIFVAMGASFAISIVSFLYPDASVVVHVSYVGLLPIHSAAVVPDGSSGQQDPTSSTECAAEVAYDDTPSP
ncbi:hypothetical protein Pelo_16954 [Pelomyxa schiedti]|nr:hypothetical protein Pelo_16954 [Pelomyxa schiedti]